MSSLGVASSGFTTPTHREQLDCALSLSGNNLTATGLTRRQRLEREFLARHRRLVHQAALRDRKNRHAFIVVPDRARVLFSTAHAGLLPIRCGRDIGPRGDRNYFCIGAKFEVAGLKLIRRAVVFEEDDFTKGLAARLKADAHLRQGCFANLPAANEDLALATGGSDDETTLANGRKNRVPVAVTEEPGAFSGMSK